MARLGPIVQNPAIQPEWIGWFSIYRKIPASEEVIGCGTFSIRDFICGGEVKMLEMLRQCRLFIQR